MKVLPIGKPFGHLSIVLRKNNPPEESHLGTLWPGYPDFLKGQVEVQAPLNTLGAQRQCDKLEAFVFYGEAQKALINRVNGNKYVGILNVY